MRHCPENFSARTSRFSPSSFVCFQTCVLRFAIAFAQCAALNAAGKIVLYFIAVLVCGCILAPPLFWLGQSFAALREEPFQRYFNRAALVAALALLWPLARSFRVKSRAELGLGPNPHWWRDL